MKCALAGAGGSETLVFDEIDAGIGGRTAVAVGNKLRELAEESQLLVITHLAQVASLASRNFMIEKVSGTTDTVARLYALGDDRVVDELCRMLGGRPKITRRWHSPGKCRDRAVAALLDLVGRGHISQAPPPGSTLRGRGDDGEACVCYRWCRILTR